MTPNCGGGYEWGITNKALTWGEGGSGPSSLMGKRAALPPADPNCCGGGFGILGRRSAG